MRKRLFGASVACVLALSLLATATVQGQDTTTMLSKFLVDLRNGVLGTAQPISAVRVGDGSAAAPSISFASDPDTGIYWNSSGQFNFSNNGTARYAFDGAGIYILNNSANITMGSSSDAVLCRGGANIIGIGGCTSSFPALKRSGTAMVVRTGDDSGDAVLQALRFNQATSGGAFSLSGSSFVYNTAPTISSGFGTSPSIVASNGTAAFTINVGTGGVATSGVIGLPTATTGWAVSCANTSTNTATVFVTKQTAFTTTSATIGNYDAAGAAAAWVASNVLVCHAHAF